VVRNDLPFDISISDIFGMVLSPKANVKHLFRASDLILQLSSRAVRKLDARDTRWRGAVTPLYP
jgi:hypothetical protein